MLKKVMKLLFPVVIAGGLCACAKADPKQCATKETCLNDPNCLCWCSQVCNYRKKDQSDNPTYVDKDPHGKFCYCKHWDRDHYVDNCILKKNIKEPKGAK